MANRRPSLALTTPRFSIDDEGQQQMQKAIQALRMKTEESLAQYRDEIARLEEVNEINQMRIEEIDEEVRKIEEEGGDKNMTDTSGRRRAKRRWSLATFGIKNQAQPEGGASQRGRTQEHARGHRRSKSVDEEEFGGDEGEAASKRKNFSIMRGRKKDLFQSRKNEKGNKMAREANLMQHLHEIQEENKKMIEQEETELRFKEEQVTALKLAFEEQGHIIDDLKHQLSEMRLDAPDNSERNENLISEEDRMRLNERLTSLNNQENEISSQLRLIRRIKDMEEEESKSNISDLKKTIVESSIRLNSVKRMSEANSDILQEKLSAVKSEWAGLSINISLTEKVSLKQISKLEKRVAKGQSDQLVDLTHRASQALQEELDMRDEPESDCTVEVIKQETESMEKVVGIMLGCCQSLSEGILLLQSKQISFRMTDTLVTTLRQMEKTIEAAENTINSSLDVIDDLVETYNKDDALIPEDVQSLAHDEVEKPDQSEKMFEESSETLVEVHLEVEDLQDRIDEVDELLQDEKLKLEQKQLQTERVLDDMEARVDDLKRRFKEHGIDWDEKDVVIEQAMKDVEDAKVAEDSVRAFLERVSRSKIDLEK